MNLKKYSSHIFVLFLLLGCTKCRCSDDYISQEKKDYHTQNSYKLCLLASIKETIDLLQSTDGITDFRKKLANRIPKWLTAGTEEKPYELWIKFYKGTIEEIIQTLRKQGFDITLLTNYYDSLGKLFKDPAEANEKALKKAIKAISANAKLIEAFKTCIETKYKQPEAILITQDILAYQDFISFILEKPNMLAGRLRKAHADLAEWKKEGRPTGEALWTKIQSTCILLQRSEVYKYPENCAAIKESLQLIDKLADSPYTLSYRDLQETIPHGIEKLKNILLETGLEENDNNDDVKSLRTYFKLVESVCR